MVFTYKGWILQRRDVALKDGKMYPIYYFAKKKSNSGTPCDMPEGYRVKEGRQVGSCMPYLTKH